MAKKSRKNVGLIGLGIIGSRVADALRLAGFHAYVWNRTPKAAPNFLATPRQVAELCDIIQIFVADAHALFEVLEAMGDAITPSHIILCNATVGPEATLDAAKLVQGRGAQFLDAPFTGSKQQAHDRELVYYIGGEEKALQAVEPVLKASSKAIVKIGKIGDAAVIKVATNMIAAVTVQAIAEAYAVVKESGIDPKMLAEGLRNHAARSGVAEAKLGKMLACDYDPHFSLKHMFKDVQLGIHIANALDVDLPATTATAGVMYGGLARGWADEDFSVLGRVYQKEEKPVTQLTSQELERDAKPEEKPGAKAEENPAGKPAAGPEPKLRESTQAELRDMGIKAPDEAATAKGSPGANPDDVTKPDPEAPKEEPAKQPAKADGKADGKSVDDKPADSKPAERQPLMRLRRWFGTGSAT